MGYPNNSAFNPAKAGPSRRVAFTINNGRNIQLSSFTINNYYIGQAEALLSRGERIIIDRMTLKGSGDAFTVERISVYGNRRVWRFQPFWLRVVLEERDADSNRLFVASHGRFLAIGDFLAPAVRRELAGTIRDALMSWRAAIGQQRTD